MFSYKAKGSGSSKGCLCRCFHCFHRHAQTRLLLGIIFVMSLAVVIFEFCIITAELLSRPQELSLHLSGRLALHLEDGDQTHMNKLSYLSSYHSHVLKKRYSLEELKTLLSNTKGRFNNGDSLTSNEYDSYDKLNVKDNEKETSIAEKLQDKNMAVSTDNIPGLDPPTSSIASNSIAQFPASNKPHTKELQNDEQGTSTTEKILDLSTVVSSHNVPGIDLLTQHVARIERVPEYEDRVYPTTSSSQVQPAVGSYLRDPTSQNQSLSVKRMQGSSKKKASLELPKDYPLFESPYPPPLVDGHLCRDSLCSEFLKPLDLYTYKTCLAKLRSVATYSNTKPGPCHFINGTRRAAVALASFPGSGNTWVRGLLEKATGVCTGAIYCDKTIRGSGMNGEAIRSGAVIAVKTHKSRKVAWTEINSPQILNNGKVPAYGSVILIVRNPYRALIAEWNRLNAALHMVNSNSNNKHVGSTGKEQFGENGGWKSFIKRKLPVWQAYFQEWVVEGHRHNKSVLVVRYEDLKLDTFKEVKRMLDFMHFEYREEELQQRLAADFSTFQRKHQETFEHFTREQRLIVDSGISTSINYLIRYNNGDALRLEDYLGTIA